MIEIFFHHKKQLFVPLITYICIITGCRETILSGLPQLQFLDGADRWGQTIKKDNKLEDIPGMLTMKKKYVIMTFLSLCSVVNSHLSWLLRQQVVDKVYSFSTDHIAHQCILSTELLVGYGEVTRVGAH